MVLKINRTTLALNLILALVLAFLLYSQWRKSHRRVRISSQVHTIPPPIVVTRDGEPLYVERPRGTDLQMTAAMASNGGPN